jgi:uncharacterized protein YndB with AHSA1/START domain
VPERGAKSTILTTTGQRESRDGEDWLVYERRIRCTAEELWAAWTEPDVLGRWVGRSEQGKLNGPSDFYFTFEGDDLLPMTYTLEHVEVGHSIGVSTRNPGDESSWRLEIDLLHDTDIMVLRVAQMVANAAVAPSIATGWEYYLDRLVAMLEDRDVSGVDYDEYFLSQAEHYRAMFPIK